MSAREVRWRRIVSIGLFLGLLWTFRRLAPAAIVFVVVVRVLEWASRRVYERTGLRPKHSVAAILALSLGAAGAGVWFSVRRAIRFSRVLKADGGSYMDKFTHSRVFVQVQENLGWDTSRITDKARELGLAAFAYLTQGAYVALFLFLGAVVAILYLFEREEVDEWAGQIDPKGLAGIMVRWCRYAGDAIAITVRLQIVVALFDAVVTLPVMLALGLPSVPLLFLVVLLCAMIPVVGGFLSGIVLSIVAYDVQGIPGVAVFLVIAFVIGKVESYYLTPRLTAAHVKLPAFVLVVSLLLFETVFGFWGLFLSFPALYVATRIGAEWRGEDAGRADPTDVVARVTRSLPPASG